MANRSAITGSDGRFTVDSVPVGSPTVTVTAIGFDQWSQPKTVQAPFSNVSVDLVHAGTRVEQDGFLIYLPPAGTTIRGVFLNLFNNTNGDSRPVLRGDFAYYENNNALSNMPTFRRKMIEFARQHGLALMGTQLAFADTMPEYNVKVLEALRSVSALSGRPELADAPFIIHGFALGGCVAFRFTARDPARVIGFINEKGSLCVDVDASRALSVPGYLIHGEMDTTPGGYDGIYGAYQRHRSMGAIWAFGIERDVGHQLMRNHDVLFNWMSDVVSRRLPDVITPGAPVLRTIDASAGSLGDLTTYFIGAWPCFSGNKSAATWLPSERSAKDWQAMISRGGITTVVPCGS